MFFPWYICYYPNDVAWDDISFQTGEKWNYNHLPIKKRRKQKTGGVYYASLSMLVFIYFNAPD